MLARLKNIIVAILPEWCKVLTQGLLLSLLLRVCFFIALYARLQIEVEKCITVLSGFFYYDMLFVASISIIAFVPYLIFRGLSSKVSHILVQSSLLLYALLSAILVEYYCNVSRPLDQVLFAYTPQEILTTVFASTNFSIVPILFFLLNLILWYVSLLICRRLVFSFPLAAVLFIVSLLSFAIFPYEKIVRSGKGYVMHSDYLLAVNQLSYTYIRIADYMKSDNQKPSLESVQLATKWWWKQNYTKSFCDMQYPFLHMDTEEDKLGPLFKMTSDGKSPNIVLIITESLGRKLTVDNPHYSFTPFLDSLSGDGLFWPNCLSSTERTFGVLPAVLASVPQGSQGFANRRFPMAEHESLLLHLQANDYATNFFYGGCASFTGQENFLEKNHIDHIMEVSLDKTKKSYALLTEYYRWGLDDKDMVDSAIAYKQSDSSQKSFFDIYLTLTSHEPFYFDDIDRYKKQVVESCGDDTSKEAEIIRAHANIYASFLYADNALRSLFQYYKTRDDFQNTIFIVTGDHRMAPVNDGLNPLRKYNVPLILYSPLLKQSRRMEPVVSHYDIAPSLTAYLRNNYHCTFPKYTHYLGECLDTSLTFNAKRMQAFMLNNRSVEEWMHDTLYVCNDELYGVRENLDLVRVESEPLLQKMKGECSQYQLLSVYAVDNDYLVKRNKEKDTLILSQKTPLLTNEMLYDRITDSVGNVWSHINVEDEFVALLVDTLFVGTDENEHIRCEVSFLLQSVDSDKPLPYIVYHLKNSNMVYSYPLVALDGSSLNTQEVEHFESKISIPVVKEGDELLVYLRTRNQSDILVKDVEIRIFAE